MFVIKRTKIVVVTKIEVEIFVYYLDIREHSLVTDQFQKCNTMSTSGSTDPATAILDKVGHYAEQTQLLCLN